ncbi:MAG: FAD binding domain-containing protein [Deltaproteobacteria bacterium]|nr:FAD binding domain-containing protein [Deltaproteobacteria bacterium]
MDWEAYFLPQSLEEALAILEEKQRAARILAGGTDLVLQQRRARNKAKMLVDISRIPGLSQIVKEDDLIHIGAMCTHSDAANSTLLNQYLPALSCACSQIGSPQIRNMGTLVGNIVSAQPGADAALALHAFETSVTIAAYAGTRQMSLPDIYAGLGLCCVDSTRELITRITVKIPGKRMVNAFERLSTRGTLTLPVVNTGVCLELHDDDSVASSRIAVGPVSPKPFRAVKAESFLVGKKMNAEVFQQAADMAARESQPRDSLLRGSRDFRRSMVSVIVRRALQRSADMRLTYEG